MGRENINIIAIVVLILILITIRLSIVLFIPGYLLSLILFRRLKSVERVCLSFGLSVFIVVFLSFFLTSISYLADIKAITTMSVWLSLLATSIIFVMLIFAKYGKGIFREVLS